MEIEASLVSTVQDSLWSWRKFQIWKFFLNAFPDRKDRFCGNKQSWRIDNATSSNFNFF